MHNDTKIYLRSNRNQNEAWLGFLTTLIWKYCPLQWTWYAYICIGFRVELSYGMLTFVLNNTHPYGLTFNFAVKQADLLFFVLRRWDVSSRLRRVKNFNGKLRVAFNVAPEQQWKLEWTIKLWRIQFYRFKTARKTRNDKSASSSQQNRSASSDLISAFIAILSLDAWVFYSQHCLCMNRCWAKSRFSANKFPEHKPC